MTSKTILFGIVLILLSSFAVADLNDGNILYYGFDWTNGDSDYDGGITSADGVLDGAGDFDGNDYIDPTNIPRLGETVSDDYTISFWMKPDSTTSFGSPITIESDAHSSWAGTDFRHGATNNIQFIAYETPSTHVGVLSSITTDWQHIVGVKEGVTLSIYRNGILQNTSDMPDGSVRYDNDETYIGAMDNDGAFESYFNGDLDEMVVYERALTIDEIEALAEGNTPVNEVADDYVYYNDMDGLYDWSNNSNHGQGNNGVTQTDNETGLISSAMDFDGVDDYIDTFSWNTDDGDWTISTWINPVDISVNGKIIFSCDSTDLNFHIDGSNLGNNDIRVYDGSSWLFDDGNYFTDNVWQHLVLTYEGTTLKVYRNNVEIHSTTTTFEGGDSGDCTIGARSDHTQSYNGLQDEFAIWNRALTTDEIEELYNSGDGYAFYDVEGANPQINTIFDTPVYEDTTTEHTITFTDYNITADSTARLIWNEVEYPATINYTDWNLTTFSANITTPPPHINNSEYYFKWQYNLTYFNTSTEQNETDYQGQYIIWNLTKYPRVNITARDLIGASDIQNFTITGGINTPTTTNGEVYVRWNETDQVNLTFSADGYATMSEMVNFTSGNFTSHQFSIYTTNSINFTIKDEITGDLITDLVNLEFISDLVSYNYTTSTGSKYVDLLQPTYYTIRYSSEDYGSPRHYYLTVTNNTHHDITLYLLNESEEDVTLTTFIVYDSTTITKLENAVVSMLRYDQISNTYSLIGGYTTDISGSAFFDLQHNTELYKILVEYPSGILKYTSSPMYITSETNNIYIDLYESPTETFYTIQDIDYTLFYNNVTNTFDTTYIDPSASASEVCLTLYKYGQYGNEELNESCSTSSSSSLSVGGMNENTTYFGELKATINGGESYLSAVWKTFYSDTLQSGNFGIFMAIVLFTIFAFLSMIHTYSVILGSTTLLFAKLMGLLQIDWTTLITVFIASVILVIIMEMKK